MPFVFILPFFCARSTLPRFVLPRVASNPESTRKDQGASELSRIESLIVDSVIREGSK